MKGFNRFAPVTYRRTVSRNLCRTANRPAMLIIFATSVEVEPAENMACVIEPAGQKFESHLCWLKVPPPHENNFKERCKLLHRKFGRLFFFFFLCKEISLFMRRMTRIASIRVLQISFKSLQLTVSQFLAKTT